MNTGLKPFSLRDFFSPAGGLSQLLPDYALRPEQLHMAEAVARALAAGQHCLAEAGTGVGKSLAYLVPGISWALEHETRLVVSTHTKALQAQLMTHELPLLSDSRAFGRALQFEICLGMENYVCLTRLLREGAVEMLPGLDPDYAQGLKQVMAWCLEPVSGIRQDAPFPLPDALWRQICAVKDLCLGKNCRRRMDCFWQAAKARQRQADVLVTNHSLFFSNVAADGKILPEYGAVILDEAHTLEDAAAGFLGEELSQDEISGLLAEIGRPGRHGLLHRFEPAGRTLADLAGRGLTALEPWWNQLRRLFPEGADTLRLRSREETGGPPPVSELETLAAELAQLPELADTEEDAKLVAYYGTRLQSGLDVLERWQACEREDAVYWAETYRNARGPRIRLRVTPLNLSALLRSALFEAGPPVVLTSATLSVNRDFTYCKSRLGLDQALEVVLDSPFPYGDQAAVYLPRAMPDPRTGDPYQQRVLEEAQSLARLFGGGMFILCTSHRFLRLLADQLRSREPDALILVQGSAPPLQLVRQFKEHANAILLGVETFWQGIDVPGDALRCVVITKLPFDVPTHPVHQAQAELLAAREENAFLAYSVPRAVLMLRQGFGRLIRRHEDRGAVAILDSRVTTRAWGKIFLDALPACPRLRTQTELEHFVDKHFNGSRRGDS